MATTALFLLFLSASVAAGAEEVPAPTPAGEILWTFDTGG